MKFLIDENIGSSIVAFLRNGGHDVQWIREIQCGMPDGEILQLALKEKRVVLTYDQDFGELVFHRQRKHSGVLLLRLQTDSVEYHLAALKNFLKEHSEDISNEFWKIDDTYL